MNRQIIAKELAKVASIVLGIDFPNKAALKKYLDEHPDADKSKHKVVSDKGSKARKVMDDAIGNNGIDEMLTGHGWRPDKASPGHRTMKHPDWGEISVDLKKGDGDKHSWVIKFNGETKGKGTSDDPAKLVSGMKQTLRQMGHKTNKKAALSRTAGGWGRFGPDLSDVIEGMVIKNKGKKGDEIFKIIKRDKSLVEMMKTEKMRDDELEEMIKEIQYFGA